MQVYSAMYSIINQRIEYWSTSLMAWMKKISWQCLLVLFGGTANVALTTENLDRSVSSELPGNPPLWVSRRDVNEVTFDLYINDAKVISADIAATSSSGDRQVFVDSIHSVHSDRSIRAIDYKPLITIQQGTFLIILIVLSLIVGLYYFHLTILLAHSFWLDIPIIDTITN